MVNKHVSMSDSGIQSTKMDGQQNYAQRRIAVIPFSVTFGNIGMIRLWMAYLKKRIRKTAPGNHQFFNFI